jgi:Tfp pilus assembly protein PilX
MRILNTKRDIRSERGVSLIIALLALVVISLLTAGLILVTQTEIWTTASYRELAQARYAAEAGVQNTINFLQYTYVAPTNYASYTMTSNPVTYNGNPVVLSAIPSVASNYPDATQQTAFSTALSTQALPGLGNASYSTSAKLLSMKPASGVSWLGAGGGGGAVQTWQITSQGSVNGVRSATVQVVATYTRTGSPLFNYPIEATSPACGSITFTSKGSLTDSYNSTNGPYSAANSSKTGGNLATNGNVNLGSGVTVDGTIFVPNTTAGPCPDGITSKGTYLGASKLSAPLNPPLPWGCTSQPCYPPGTLTTAAQNVSTSCGSVPGCTKNGTTALFDGGKATTANVFALAPGAYGNITINGADVVHVSAGTYNINSINFALDGQFVVDSGPVVFNLVGNCASGCPTESLPSGYSSTEVIYGAGYAGFNGCSGGVTANPNVYGATTCGPSKAPFSGIPNQLQMVYGGTNTVRLGGMPNATVIYAPSAGYYTPGAPVGLYGSAIIGKFEDASGSPFHYDAALQNSVEQVGPYQLIGFSWSKF